MNKIIISLFFILINYENVYSQKCIKIMNSQNEAIPFATIVNSDNSYGKYTNEKGEICIDINLLTDTIFVSSIGYKKLKISKKQYLLGDTFILKENVQELKEITVKSSTIKRNSFYSHNKVFLSVWKSILNPNSNVLMAGFIENTTNQDNQIEKVKVTFFPEKSKIADRFKIRCRLYENRDKKPFHELTESNIIAELKPLDKNLEFNLENYNISFPPNGIWVGVEVVGYYNFDNLFIPLENGKAGKATYKNNGKIKNIDLVSPSYELVKSKSNIHYYTKDFLDRWKKGINFANPEINYSPKIEIITFEN